MSKQIDLLQGTLDMLILKAVSLDGLHGHGSSVVAGVLCAVPGES